MRGRGRGRVGQREGEKRRGMFMKQEEMDNKALLCNNSHLALSISFLLSYRPQNEQISVKIQIPIFSSIVLRIHYESGKTDFIPSFPIMTNSSQRACRIIQCSPRSFICEAYETKIPVNFYPKNWHPKL